MFFLLLTTLPLMNCSSDWNKWKSVGAKSGDYGGYGRTSYFNDLIFVEQCVVPPSWKYNSTLPDDILESSTSSTRHLQTGDNFEADYIAAGKMLPLRTSNILLWFRGMFRCPVTTIRAEETMWLTWVKSIHRRELAGAACPCFFRLENKNSSAD